MDTGQRLGLALSGGGFRASFFHLGVLAQLARWGVLRHVELLSTVSGGSVIGALYYLHVKRLLESKPDAAVRDEDYVELVQQLDRDFLAGVQRNVRMHIFANPLKNLRMAMGNYSRSDRIGELYDAFFYRPVTGGERPVAMRELKIRPQGEAADFHPLRHNERRQAKVPILMINATTLNTGGNWRFEASRMGEPSRDRPVDREIDKGPRLGQPAGYEDLPPHQRDLELGLAVAASTAVPGLFHPLALSGLYPDLQVQLVDGGVHDNQGVQALLDRGCTHFIISDASVQLDFDDHPATAIASVLLRTNAIFMSRVRGEQLVRVLESRREATALMHLRRGLAHRTIYPKGVQRPERDEEEAQAEVPGGTAGSRRFGVAPEVQECLARIRTDLDAFTEVEAFSLMLDAYLMSDAEFRRMPFLTELRNQTSRHAGEPQHWRFEAVRPWLEEPTREYLSQLEIGADSGLKAFRMNPLATGAVAASLVGLLAAAGYARRDAVEALLDTRLRLQDLVAFAAAAVVALLPGTRRWLSRIRALRAPVRFAARFVTRALPALLISPLVWPYLWLVDPLFLAPGRIQRLRRKEE